jgi:spoIIIJ-associated protein
METAYSNASPADSPDNASAATAAAAAAPEVPSITLDQLSDLAKEVLGAMLPLLSFEAKLTSNIENNTVRIRMECEDAGRLIGRRGATVNEIQFLLNRILQRRHKAVPRIFLDVDGFKEEEAPEVPNHEAVERVKSMADQVRRWGEAVDTEPMTPADRKVVEEFYSRDKELAVVPIQSKEDGRGLQRMRIQLKNK